MDWGAFESKDGFEVVELLYSRSHMSEGNIDALLKKHFRGRVPFSDHKDIHAAIDGLTVGGTAWQSFEIEYTGMPTGSGNINTPQPKWMSDVHEVFYHDPQQVLHEMLANPNFTGLGLTRTIPRL